MLFGRICWTIIIPKLRVAHQESQLIRKQHHGDTLTECPFSRSTLAVKSNMNNDIIEIYIHNQLFKNS